MKMEHVTEDGKRVKTYPKAGEESVKIVLNTTPGNELSERGVVQQFYEYNE
jgi:hypothetical protein